VDLVNELKETYLRRIQTAIDMIADDNTPKQQKDRLRVKVSCYKYFITELQRG
jgi:hypothetical protein